MSYKVIEGKNPILVSAPHVYPHRRPSLAPLWKAGEPHTDEIVVGLVDQLNCFGIFTVSDTDPDPNYYSVEQNPYKQRVRDLHIANSFDAFIDIHGLSDKHLYDIGIFYVGRFLRSKRLAYNLANALNRRGLRGSIIQIYKLDPYNRQETLAEFTTVQLRIPSVQIEIARYIREDGNLLNDVVENLAGHLRKVTEDLSQ